MRISEQNFSCINLIANASHSNHHFLIIVEYVIDVYLEWTIIVHGWIIGAYRCVITFSFVVSNLPLTYQILCSLSFQHWCRKYEALYTFFIIYLAWVSASSYHFWLELFFMCRRILSIFKRPCSTCANNDNYLHMHTFVYVIYDNECYIWRY